MTSPTHTAPHDARELLNWFPWFDIPLLELHRADQPLPARLAILSRYRPTIVRPVCRENEAELPAPPPVQDDTFDIIDEFMRSGEHRITANAHTPEELPDPQTDGLPSDDLLTEELAAIYLAQGMTGPAIEIYRRLSLLNPEKSVYFAEIIAMASAKEPAGSDCRKNEK